jgi:hypothetical protein
MDQDTWISPTPHRELVGTEVFSGTAATVTDFWRFSLGDLRMNSTRGYLAEFLVAQALGVKAFRVEWDAFDLLFGEIRVEVKSSAYLQSWKQPRLSTITFGGLQARMLKADNSYEQERTFNADVYVFCTQTCQSHDLYDPLDVSQWSFDVVSAGAIAALSQKSLGLNTVRKLSGGATPFADLAGVVRESAKRE